MNFVYLGSLLSKSLVMILYAINLVNVILSVHRQIVYCILSQDVANNPLFIIQFCTPFPTTFCNVLKWNNANTWVVSLDKSYVYMFKNKENTWAVFCPTFCVCLSLSWSQVKSFHFLFILVLIEIFLIQKRLSNICNCYKRWWSSFDPHMVFQAHQAIVKKLVDLIGITSIMEVGHLSLLHLVF